MAKTGSDATNSDDSNSNEENDNDHGDAKNEAKEESDRVEEKARPVPHYEDTDSQDTQSSSRGGGRKTNILELKQVQ